MFLERARDDKRIQSREVALASLHRALAPTHRDDRDDAARLQVFCSSQFRPLLLRLLRFPQLRARARPKRPPALHVNLPLLQRVSAVHSLVTPAGDAPQHAVVHLDRARRARGVVAQRGLAFGALGLDLAVEALRAAVGSLALGLRGAKRSATTGANRETRGAGDGAGDARETYLRRADARRQQETRRDQTCGRPAGRHRARHIAARACVLRRCALGTVFITSPGRLPLFARMFSSSREENVATENTAFQSARRVISARHARARTTRAARGVPAGRAPSARPSHGAAAAVARLPRATDLRALTKNGNPGI